MARISQLQKNNELIYPRTTFDAVLASDGSTLTSKYEYIRSNYSKKSDLIQDLDINFDPSNKTLELSLGETILSTINTDNFSISGILNSASFSNDILTLGFTSGESVNIDLTEILTSILTDYRDEVAALRNLHHVVSESEYNEILDKDPDVFYYVYEEED